MMSEPPTETCLKCGKLIVLTQMKTHMMSCTLLANSKLYSFLLLM